MRLEKLLTEDPMLHNPENTLIICNDENEEFVKEAATGYNIVKLPALGSAGSMIIEGTIKPLTKEDNEPEYDFKFTSLFDCRKKVKPTIDNSDYQIKIVPLKTTGFKYKTGIL